MARVTVNGVSYGWSDPVVGESFRRRWDVRALVRAELEAEGERRDVE